MKFSIEVADFEYDFGICKIRLQIYDIRICQKKKTYSLSIANVRSRKLTSGGIMSARN